MRMRSLRLFALWAMCLFAICGGATASWAQNPVLSATPGSTSVTLSWTANGYGGSGIVSRLLRRVSAGSPQDVESSFLVVSDINTYQAGTYVDSGLSGGKTYTYKIYSERSARAAGTLNPVPLGESNEVTATPTAAPTAPNILLGLQNGKPYLSWGATANTSAYYVRRSTSYGGPYTIVGNLANNVFSFTDVNVTPGVRYYYYVSAVNSGATQSANSYIADVLVPSGAGA